MNLDIKRVVKVKQKEPAVFEATVRLADGTAIVVALSAVALTELTQYGERTFQLGTAAST